MVWGIMNKKLLNIFLILAFVSTYAVILGVAAWLVGWSFWGNNPMGLISPLVLVVKIVLEIDALFFLVIIGLVNKYQKKLVWKILVGILTISTLMSFYSFASQKNGPRLVKYESKENCEVKTGSACIYYLCDIPIGVLYEKICQEGPGSGYYNSKKLEGLSVPDVDSWKSYTHSSCGVNAETQLFSIEVPANMAENNNSNERGFGYYTYSIDKDNYLELSCGTGIRNGCDKANQIDFVINGEKVGGCLEKNTSNGKIEFSVDYWSSNERFPRMFFSGQFDDTPENVNLIKDVVSSFKY